MSIVVSVSEQGILRTDNSSFCDQKGQFVLLLVGQLPKVDTLEFDSNSRGELDDFRCGTEEVLLRWIGQQSAFRNLDVAQGFP